VQVVGAGVRASMRDWTQLEDNSDIHIARLS
jgi:hypothetical protein